MRAPAAGAAAPAATVGIVTPYRAQADELARRFVSEPRVSVGTPSSFQGHEHDAMVLSLVADGADHRFDRAQRQHELWTVALSRARYLLVVVGDRAVWRRAGRGRRRAAGRLRAAATTTRPVDDDLGDRLDNALSEVPGAEREVAVRGHAADAVLGDGGHRRPVLIDRGAQVGTDPAVHLARMLRLVDVLGDAGDPAARLDPARLRRRGPLTHRLTRARCRGDVRAARPVTASPARRDIRSATTAGPSSSTASSTNATRNGPSRRRPARPRPPSPSAHQQRPDRDAEPGAELLQRGHQRVGAGSSGAARRRRRRRCCRR